MRHPPWRAWLGSSAAIRGSGLCSTTTLPFTPWYRGALNSPARGDYTELSDRLRQYDRERSATPLSESLARGDGKDVAGGVGRLPQQGSPSSGGPVGRPVGSVSEGESGNGLPESAGSGEEVKDGPIADLADNARRSPAAKPLKPFYSGRSILRTPRALRFMTRYAPRAGGALVPTMHHRRYRHSM
jgi:hypothetical protein